MSDARFLHSVYVQRTGLLGYSAGWADATAFAEAAALEDLNRLARWETGCDLFEQAIRPGDTVVIKPNLVRHWHPAGLDLYSVITHPAVIRAVVDNVYRAQRGEGRIVIADAPMGDTDFDALRRETGIERIADFYRRRYGFEIEILDLRDYREVARAGPGGYDRIERVRLSGDPLGYAEVDLGSYSAFDDLGNLHLLEGTSGGRRHETIASHRPGANRYAISRTVLEADVLVSVPKLKTHCKVGLTLNCKGMVGINGSKNRLPHFRYGSPAEGGDQFPDAFRPHGVGLRIALGRMMGEMLVARQTRWAAKLLDLIQSLSGPVARKVLHLRPLAPITAQSGNWPGNDTCWRLAVDLIRIALFADKAGVLHETPQRRFISIVDGIVAGEGDGPLNPTPRACGLLAGGLDPLAVDLACARLVGFDYRRIRYLAELCRNAEAAGRAGSQPLQSPRPRIVSNEPPWNDGLGSPSDRALGFTPPARWLGQVELAEERPWTAS